jgi:hypothetical protein
MHSAAVAPRRGGLRLATQRACEGAPGETPPEEAALPAKRTIAVVTASYGENCGAKPGNSTGALAKACDGQPSCDYTVDYGVLGDPAPGCAKTYVAEWRCGEGDLVRRQVLPGEAGLGSRLSLRCEGPPQQ